MSSTESINAVKSFFDTLNRADWEDHIDQFFAGQEWWEGWLAVQKDLRHAFPDWQYTIEQIAADGDIVCLTGVDSGTHQAEFPYGELKGVAPTGKKAAWKVAWWMKIKDGKPIEGGDTIDGVSRMHQLGIITLDDWVGY